MILSHLAVSLNGQALLTLYKLLATTQKTFD